MLIIVKRVNAWFVSSSKKQKYIVKRVPVAVLMMRTITWGSSIGNGSKHLVGNKGNCVEDLLSTKIPTELPCFF